MDLPFALARFNLRLRVLVCACAFWFALARFAFCACDCVCDCGDTLGHRISNLLFFGKKEVMGRHTLCEELSEKKFIRRNQSRI